MENVDSGTFIWAPQNVASGAYIVYVSGPGMNIKKKIVVVR
jgi:hypothetical protein